MEVVVITKTLALTRCLARDFSRSLVSPSTVLNIWLRIINTKNIKFINTISKTGTITVNIDG